MTNRNTITEMHTEPTRARREDRGHTGSDRLAMTPMIDVTFQLLLFFLLTMTFRMAEGMIPGALPQAGGVIACFDITEPIDVKVRPAGEHNTGVMYEIAGHGRPIANGHDLHAVLQQRAELSGLASPVHIQPSPNVEWGYVVEVFNQASRCGFQEINFAPSAHLE